MVKAAAARNPSIRFLGPVSNMAALYAAVDVVLLPSDHESNPIVVIEALCASAGLIISDIPAHQFAKAYRGVGFANDAAQMAQAMAQATPKRFERDLSALDIAKTARAYEALGSELIEARAMRAVRK